MTTGQAAPRADGVDAVPGPNRVVPPRLHPAVRVSPPVLRAGRPVHVLADTRIGALYQVGEREAFIVARLDGSATVDDIDLAYRRRFGKALGPGSWGQIFGLLGARQLLADGRDDTAALARLHDSARRLERSGQGLLSRRWSLVDPQPFLDAVLRWLPALTRRGVVVPLTVLVAVMAADVLRSWSTLWPGYQATWRDRPAVGLASLLVVVLSLAVHEACHGLATRAMGGSCREMGIAWRFPLVTFYTRVDDVTFLARRGQRVVVALVGVVGQLAVLLPFWAVLLVTDGGPAHQLSVCILLTGTVAALVNLIPFLDLDGEKAVSHSLGVWDVGSETRHHAVRLIRARGGGPSAATRAQRAAMLAYGLAVVAVAGVLLAWGASRWWTAFGQHLSPQLLLLQGAVVVAFWAVALGLRHRRRPAAAPVPPGGSS